MATKVDSFYSRQLTSSKRDAFYKRLIEEAPFIPGDKMELLLAKDIPWIDLPLLQEGINFGRRNIYSVFMANTAALMYGFSVKPESVVLLRSGKFHTPEKSFLRFLSTANRIGSWFITGISDEESEGYKNIQIVRKLHQMYGTSKAPLPTPEEMSASPEKERFAQIIREELAFFDDSDAPHNLLSWDPPMNFSQFDMTMTQFGFIGLLYLFPESLGVRMEEEKGMQGYFHLWAVIGRMLGIEDRFNLALNPDLQLFKKLYLNVGVASLKSTDETVICLQQALIDGISRRLPLLTFKAWTYYGLSQQVDGFKGDLLWGEMNWKDKTSFFLVKSSFKLIHKSSVIRILSNIFVGILLQLAIFIYLPKNSGCPF